MTPNEAADLLRHGAMLAGYKNGKRMDEAIEMAIDALEKQIPMKPMPKELSMSGMPIIPCGNCGEEIKRDYDFCPTCGQKVDWGRNEQRRSKKVRY